MAMAKEIMGGGISAGAAQAINGQVATVSAAGSTISDATALNAGHNIVSSVSSGQGVQLPNTQIGDEIYVYNGTLTALAVYPPTGSTINQLSASTSVSLGGSTAAFFKKATATSWTAMVSA